MTTFQTHSVGMTTLLDRVREIHAERDHLLKTGKITEADKKAREAGELLSSAEGVMLRERADRIGRLDPNTPPSPLFFRHSDDDPTATSEYQRAYDAYMRQYSDPRGYGEQERNALSVSSDGSGGYTVSADRRNQMIARRAQLTPILGLLTEIPTDSDVLEYPRLVKRPTDGSIYTSNFTGAMIAEVPPASGGETDPAFGLLKIQIQKARAITKFSRNLADDFPLLPATLENDGAKNLGLLMLSQVLVGDGVGPNVLGIFNHPTAVEGSQTENQIGTTDVSGTTADQISNTTAALGSATKLLDLYYSVPSQYRESPGFAWTMHSDSEKRIRLLTDAQGRFLWAEGFAGRPSTLLGHPLLSSDFVAKGGTDGNKVIACGDWSEGILAMRTSLSVQLLLERFADTEQIAMILRTRFGFAPANLDAFRIGIV